MGPSPSKETSGETTSWRLCLARSRGAVRGTGGTAKKLGGVRVQEEGSTLGSGDYLVWWDYQVHHMTGMAKVQRKQFWSLGSLGHRYLTRGHRCLRRC